MRNIKKGRSGLTLIEVTLAIAIIGMIIISFMPLFIMSAKNNNKSENMLSATYLGKDAMELAYHLSKTVPYEDLGDAMVGTEGYKSLSNGAYGFKYSDDKYIHIQFTKDENEGIVKVHVKVYKDQAMNQLEVQYESLYIWEKG